MSLLRPLPAGTPHALSDEGTAFLPPFVRVRMRYLADSLEWGWAEEEDSMQFTYYEVRGKLSDGLYTLDWKEHISPVHIWLAGDDNCNRSLYIGGSATWICPDNHTLYFDAIDPTLLPPAPVDVNVWWCIHYEDDIKVFKIVVCPPGEITEQFPDGV